MINESQSDPNGRIKIFDTTLRDGEQSPGCSMSEREKIRVAHALAEMGIDIIEAGFPIASEGDFESVRRIAREIEGPVIAGLARCAQEDIDRAWNAVKDSAGPRIHVFLATSAIHREHKLNMAKEEIIRRAVEGVTLARGHCEDVEFSPEDASRTEVDFLVEVVERVIEAGATTINIPDTVGYAIPSEFGDIFRVLREQVRGIDGVTLSAHCHNDLGLAVANSLAAIENGAGQVECTVNGIGERAGNAALEEIVMSLRMRSESLGGADTAIDTKRLYQTSRLVSTITGSMVQRNKAIVGENAFAHEAGIHQHGVLSHRATYEIMDPASVGIDKNKLVLGKHSGKHAIRDRIMHLGLEVTDEELEVVVRKFKTLADKKKELYDADLEAIVLEGDAEVEGPWRIVTLSTTNRSDDSGTATIVMEEIATGESVSEAAVGDGPIHAAFKAIKRISGVEMRLDTYRVNSVTSGSDAQGEAVIDVVGDDGMRFRGRGISTDVVEASAEAILDVTNRIIRRGRRVAAAMEKAGV